jgi:hypothetical protein
LPLIVSCSFYLADAPSEIILQKRNPNLSPKRPAYSVLSGVFYPRVNGLYDGKQWHDKSHPQESQHRADWHSQAHHKLVAQYTSLTSRIVVALLTCPIREERRFHMPLRTFQRGGRPHPALCGSTADRFLFGFFTRILPLGRVGNATSKAFQSGRKAENAAGKAPQTKLQFTPGPTLDRVAPCLIGPEANSSSPAQRGVYAGARKPKCLLVGRMAGARGDRRRRRHPAYQRKE